MLELSKEQIRRLAVDDTTYNRGVRYYRSKAVTNVTWSQGLKQYQAAVHGKNDYRVTIRLNEDETDFCYNCNCPSRIKHQGACKHIVAMLLFLSDYIRMMREKPEEEENMTAFRIIHYFQKHEETIVYGLRSAGCHCWSGIRLWGDWPWSGSSAVRSGARRPYPMCRHNNAVQGSGSRLRVPDM